MFVFIHYTNIWLKQTSVRHKHTGPNGGGDRERERERERESTSDIVHNNVATLEPVAY